VNSDQAEDSPSGDEENDEAEELFIEHGVRVERLEDLEPEDDLTDDSQEATEEGYPYLAPSDPSVLPSEDLEGARIAAGFAPSMEESHPDQEVMPARVEKGDLELEKHVYEALRDNSETQNLTDIEVCVSEGVVLLQGTVQSEDDIAMVDDIVTDLDGVRAVRNDLRVAT
jgi:hypothetical protein